MFDFPKIMDLIIGSVIGFWVLHLTVQTTIAILSHVHRNDSVKVMDTAICQPLVQLCSPGVDPGNQNRSEAFPVSALNDHSIQS